MTLQKLSAVCFDLIGVVVVHGSVDQRIVAIAQNLRNKELKTLSYSNNPKATSEEINRYDPFLHVFEESYYADTLAPKSEEGFRLLSQRANIRPAECLVIDDMLANLKAAESVGFITHYFDRTQKDPYAQLQSRLYYFGIANG